MFEFKYPQFKIIPLSSSDNNDPNETDLEWIGMVEMEGESGRLYSARTRTWETLKGNPAELVMLKKRAGQWYIMDSFRKTGLLPNLSCQEIAKLRK